MVTLLRMKCYNCHKLRAESTRLKRFLTKFKLLHAGEYEQVLGLEDAMAARQRNESDSADVVSSNKAITEHLKNVAIANYCNEINAQLDRRPPRSTPPSAYEEDYKRSLIKALVSECKAAKKCPHCGAFGPKIRQDQSNKIFQTPLSKTARRVNAAEGIRLQPALTKDSATEKHRREEGNDSDDENDRNIGPAMGDSDDEDDADDNETPSAKDKYVHPAEVQAQMRRTWQTNPELCNFAFAVQGYEIFFIQAVPVPPNRYRPPMHLGGMMVEHAQNGYLNKILQANELVRKNFAANNEAMAYTAWIELQTHLNCFMDSSKDPSSNLNPPLGIRQLLERKDGIFRKHMMGKRVNHACRSVISPDPYIGVNEIGLPRYFAETLTYPTPVTDINIGEMRELVERGAFNYPGARWVEFPDRRVDLSKMNDHTRQAIAARLLTYARKGGKPAIVGRQLRDGDMVLMNRQVSPSV
jgi:DNA-directed RNA polymerase I subunit RPA1